MNEQDKQIVEAAKAWADKYYLNKEPGENIKALIEIIERLDTQLTEIVEAGEPFVEKHELPTAEDFRRLAQKLEEVKDE